MEHAQRKQPNGKYVDTRDISRGCAARPKKKGFRESKQKTAHQNVRQLHEQDSDDDDTFVISAVAHSTKAWEAEVSIEGQPLNCRVDTGADCCVISKRLLHTLTKRTAQECSVRLSSFFGHVQTANCKSPLHIVGTERLSGHFGYGREPSQQELMW